MVFTTNHFKIKEYQMRERDLFNNFLDKILKESVTESLMI